MAVSVFMPAERPTMHYIRRQALSQSASEAFRLSHPPPTLFPALSNGPSVSPSGSHTASQAVRQSVTKEALEK